MRVQHNIAAMNSYRNYNNNTNSINKNLEKLSSGYKINRAGDDAAGLAISEKMRAQITGLAGAQKNAKDGISLVQTAEGALTEVHSMLNRMYELAEESANGTFEGIDREQLQKEVDQLREEINRIADSSNFNGLNLLDGSLSATGSAGSAKAVTADLSKLGVDVVANATTFKGVKGKYETGNLLIQRSDTAVAADTPFAVAKGDWFEFTVNYTDADGKEQTSKLTIKADAAITTGTTTAAKSAFVLVNDDGTETKLTMSSPFTTAGKVTAAQMAKVIDKAIDKQQNAEIRSNFTVDPSGTTGAGSAKLTFESKALGSEGAVLNGYTLQHFPKSVDLVADDRNDNSNTTTFLTDVSKTVNPLDAGKAYSMTEAKVWDNLGDAASTATKAEKKLEDAIFEVNGQKFVFYKGTLTRENMEELNAAGVSNFVLAGASTVSATTADGKKAIGEMAQKIATATNLSVKLGSITSSVITTLAKTSWDTGSSGYKWLVLGDNTASAKGKAGGGLTLQIGDTAASYNQLNVDIGDVHVKALGIDEIDISVQGKAQDAMDKLKTAINDVSSIRGTLGATQNRLEHTINNLSVMQENIQDAESTVRDTDVANEMMKYTKNSILVQSAQAMLAQANQQPQGVLQLLQ